MENSNITNTPISSKKSSKIVRSDDLESTMSRLQNNLNTMADRMQMLVRALNQNMVDEVEMNRPKPLNIKKIRSLKWTKGKGDTCTICHEAMPLKAKKLACKHKFCPECIIPWLKVSASCPTCRKSVE